MTFPSHEKMVTRCEMKNKAVQRGDIDRALQKIAGQGKHVQFSSSSPPSPWHDDIREYARSNMTKLAVSKSRFSIASDSCGISCIFFTGCGGIFWINTNPSFFTRRTVRSARA